MTQGKLVLCASMFMQDDGDAGRGVQIGAGHRFKMMKLTESTESLTVGPFTWEDFQN